MMELASAAIVRPPSARLAEGEVTHLARQIVDVERAFAQHAAYVALLRRLGLQILEAPAAPEHPDGLFVEDALVMLERGRTAPAVLTRPGALSRRGEVASLEPLLRELGMVVHRIVAPATLDGGDVLVTPRHVLVGASSRSNAEAVAQLTSIAAPRRRVVAIAVHGALHLKSAVTALPDGSLIAVPRWVSVERLTELGYRVHAAPEPSGGDVLCVGETVILPADAPATAALIGRLGFAVEAIDVSELQKIEAGVTCMSVLL